MKKILFTLILYIALGNVVWSQDTRFGFSAGTEISNYSIDYPITSGGKLTSRLGFKLAVELELPISDNFYIVPEIAFVQRGAKVLNWRGEGIRYDSIFTKVDQEKIFERMDTVYVQQKGNDTDLLNYLQLPVNLMYKFSIGENGKFFVFAGPYIAMALYGNTLTEGIQTEGKNDGTVHSFNRDFNERFKFGSGEDEYKKFDFGFNLGFGFEYSDFFLKFQYNRGLTNMFNHEYSQKNTNVGISVGYLF